MTDGDRQMFSSFDCNQKEFYPNAILVLCMCHLVTKGVERLHSYLVGTDKEEVKQMLTKFKHAIFSWCRVNECENWDEFRISKCLLEDWLTELQENERGDVDKHVCRNAPVLLDFLRNNILPKKHRFLAFLRKDRLCLDYRSNSALESMNQSMKVTCDPNVRPDMTLLESIKTQDAQRGAAMDLLHKENIRMYNASGLWAPGSKTVSFVLRKC